MEITKTTVNASDGHFEEHPESYRPRVFAAIMPPMQYRRGGEDGLARTGRKEREESKVYEILSNGQAIPWPSLPCEGCDFDFWVLYVESLSDVTMMRHAPLTEVEVQGKTYPLLIPRIPQAVWDALKESQDMAEKASQATCYPYHADIPTLKPIMGSSGKVQIGEVVEYNPVPQADGDGCTCLKGGSGCDTWEEYPGQPWGEFAKNSECPIYGEDR
jgi:hypothetical protein